MNILEELRLIKEKLSKLENDPNILVTTYWQIEDAIDHIDEAIKELEV